MSMNYADGGRKAIVLCAAAQLKDAGRHEWILARTKHHIYRIGIPGLTSRRGIKVERINRSHVWVGVVGRGRDHRRQISQYVVSKLSAEERYLTKSGQRDKFCGKTVSWLFCTLKIFQLHHLKICCAVHQKKPDVPFTA
eukprot:IDg12910t1